MDQTHGYIGIALNVAFVAAYLWLLGLFLWNHQWKMVLLSLLFSFCGGGFLIALVVGWQEAANWKIQRFMKLYSALLVVCFLMFAHTLFISLTTPSPPPVMDPKTKARMKTAPR
jgi:hypothetical protein